MDTICTVKSIPEGSRVIRVAKRMDGASLLTEPPRADPHAGWCGGWRRETSGYPIWAAVRRLIGCGMNSILSVQPTASAYLLSDAMDGACFPAPSSLDTALFVVPMRSATAS